MKCNHCNLDSSDSGFRMNVRDGGPMYWRRTSEGIMQAFCSPHCSTSQQLTDRGEEVPSWIAEQRKMYAAK